MRQEQNINGVAAINTEQSAKTPTYDSLMGTKIKSFWNRSTCRVHVFTLLCFFFWILGNQKTSNSGVKTSEASEGVRAESDTHGRLVVSAAFRRSLWFSLL